MLKGNVLPKIIEECLYRLLCCCEPHRAALRQLCSPVSGYNLGQACSELARPGCSVLLQPGSAGIWAWPSGRTGTPKSSPPPSQLPSAVQCHTAKSLFCSSLCSASLKPLNLWGPLVFMTHPSAWPLAPSPQGNPWAAPEQLHTLWPWCFPADCMSACGVVASWSATHLETTLCWDQQPCSCALGPFTPCYSASCRLREPF